MSTRYRALHLPVLVAGLGLMLPGPALAQTFTTLHSFTRGTEGANPFAGLILTNNTLYGTAPYGGSSYSLGNVGSGTVFKINTDGSGFTTLYSFTPTSVSYPQRNSDGANPYAGLILSGNTLYGTAASGGPSGNGTVFALSTDGTGFTNLYSFTTANTTTFINPDGVSPSGTLILLGNTLYGTAQYGGSSGNGTVFALNTDGKGFTNLHSFTAFAPNTIANSDGAHPAKALILSGNTLYGTAQQGGSSGNGTVFKINIDGSGFTTLYSFTDLAPFTGPYVNSDGAHPDARLFLSGNTLYGTAQEGGSSGNGTVFALNTDGTGFTALYNFSNGSDGASPAGGLILSGDTLYGTAGGGGASANGTLFAINTDGTGYTNLYSFTGAFPPDYTNSDGGNPIGELILSGGVLYGVALNYGGNGAGTVFSLSLGAACPPQLTLIPSGPNVILSWPTDATRFLLQSTTTLGLSAVWTTNSPAPVVVNGQNTVTNPISGAQQFFRLSQ